MSERFIQNASEVLPYLKNIEQKEAYGKLTSRQSQEDIDWFVGNPNSLAAHRLGYERDELTPSHDAATLQQRVSGAKGSLGRDTIVAYRSLIVPSDDTETGIERFIHGRLTGSPTQFRQYGHVLVNEASRFGRRTEDEASYMFRLPQIGLNLAAIAVNHHLNGLHFTDLVDERTIPDIKAAHKEAQDRMILVRAADARRIKAGTQYFF